MMDKVGVIGAGLMGAEIGLVCALSGRDVLLTDTTEEALAKATANLAKIIDKGIQRGHYRETDRAALDRIRTTTDLAAHADRDLIVEAVFEDEKVKAGIFGTLDKVCRADATIVSNTSTISITTLASYVSPERRARFAGTHYFSPVSRMKLVEVIPGLDTDEATVTALMAFGQSIGKTPIRVKDVVGFAVNRMLHVFIIEAIPAVILGFVVLAYMTDKPEDAKWLKDDERAWLSETMNAERAAKAAAASHSIWKGLSDPRVLALALVYFGTSAGLYTLGVWAPQIIKGFGMSNMAVGFLNAVPPTVAVVAMYLWSWHSDKTSERTWHVVVPCLAAAIGLTVAGLSSSVVAVVAALVLVNVGISAAKPPLWSMPTLFLSGPAAAAGIATINSIGNLGGFFGPAMIGWIKDQTGSFAGGLWFVAALLVLSAALTLVLARSAARPAAVVNAR